MEGEPRPMMRGDLRLRQAREASKARLVLKRETKVVPVRKPRTKELEAPIGCLIKIDPSLQEKLDQLNISMHIHFRIPTKQKVGDLSTLLAKELGRGFYLIEALLVPPQPEEVFSPSFHIVELILLEFEVFLPLDPPFLPIEEFTTPLDGS